MAKKKPNAEQTGSEQERTGKVQVRLNKEFADNLTIVCVKMGVWPGDYIEERLTAFLKEDWERIFGKGMWTGSESKQEGESK